MKNRSLLAKKLKLFYNEIDSKRNGKMTLQTDLEFNQNANKRLNKEFSVEMFHTRVQVVRRSLLNKKLASLKRFFYKVNAK